MRHDFKKIEPKWQAKWEESKIFRAVDGSDKPKFYGLVEFPYPSGAGMHVGHIKAYSSIEVVSRKRRMQGYNVLFPIGFDAYGLPTENYAIKTKTHPRIITDKNIARFSEQLKRVGFSFDWDRVIDTTINGLSGFSLKCLKKDLYTGIRHLLIIAHHVRLYYLTRTARAVSAISVTARLYRSQRLYGI